MGIISFEGTVENGQIRVPEHVKLPDHAKVYVVIPDYETAPQARVYTPRLAHLEEAADFAKEDIELPADAEL